jgi:hypothetical protein
VCPLGQRRGAARPGRCQPQCGIEPQRIGVVLVTPALCEEQQHGAQQVGQGIGHQMRLAWIVQPFCQPFNDPTALHHLAHDHRPRVAGQAFDAGLDDHARVEARMKGRWRFTHGLFGSR